ncbi:MAG: hypothetical protein CL916_02070 [Deltaproteobacteria bacterium]|nr:hypothetical protein [Deltaproteobacteria bacterium]
MSRFSCTLRARPVEINKAVEGLEDRKREWKDEVLSFQGLMIELPKIPKDKLKKMKLRKSAQELLPYVLVEQDLKSTVLDALFLLIESKCEQFSLQTRYRIFAYGLKYPQIRKIGYQYYQKNPPEDSEPRWIAVFWKRIFCPEEPEISMARIAFENQVPIIQVADWFEMNPYVPWMDGLLIEYLDHHSADWLRDCSFWDVSTFIHSSAPIYVRSSILVWILNSYVQDWADWDDVSEPYRMLIDSARDFWGEPYRTFWKNCSTKVCTIGLWPSNLD